MTLLFRTCTEKHIPIRIIIYPGGLPVYRLLVRTERIPKGGKYSEFLKKARILNTSE